MTQVYEVFTKLSMVDGVSASLAVIAKEILRVEGSVTALQGKLTSLNKLSVAVAGGLAAVGGVAVLTAFKNIASHGDKLLDQQDKLQRAGMGLNEVLRLQADYYNRIAKSVPTSTASEYLKTFNELRSVVGADKAADVTPWSLKLEAIIANATGKSAEGEGFKLWRAMEMTGRSISDPAGTQKLADAFAKNIIGSGGKLDANTYATMAKRGGVSYAHASPEFLAGAMSVVAADLGGDTSGTALQSLYQLTSGATKMSVSQMAELRKLGAIDPNKIHEIPGSSSVKVDPGAIFGSELARSNPYEWVQKILMPRERALYGNNNDAIESSMAVIGRNRNVMRMLMMFSDAGFMEQIHKDTTQWSQAHSIDRSYNDFVSRNPKGVRAAFDGQYESMMQAIGAPMMQAALPVMKSVTDMFTKIGDFANKNPETIKKLGEGLMVLGGALVAGGAAAMIAALGPAGWFVGGLIAIGGAVTVFRKDIWGGLGDGLSFVGKKFDELLAFMQSWGERFGAWIDMLRGKLWASISGLFSKSGGGSASDSFARMRNMSALGGGGPGFSAVAPQLMADLQRDYGLTKEQAAGIVGNLGHESAGFTAVHEAGQAANRGGYGWAQWTGPRREEFMAYASSHGLGLSSYAANYGMLRKDLDGRYGHALAAVKGTGNAYSAMLAFEKHFENAGVKAYGSRANWTRRALGVVPPPPRGEKHSQIMNNIHVDGQAIARVMTKHLARLHEHSTRAPFFNGHGMWAGTDIQYSNG